MDCMTALLQACFYGHKAVVAAHFKARPSLVNLLENGHVKGAWLGFR